MTDSTEPQLDFGFGFNDANFSDRILRLVIIPDDKFTPGSIPDQSQNSKGDEGSNVESNSENYEERLIHVSSLLLAVNSPFFRKLFSNGMRESAMQLVNLHIQASEEAAVMDLLKFMYSGTLSGATPAALLDVAMAAEKFEVASCMKLCKKLLHDSPMTFETALLYLDTAATNLIAADIITPLSDAANKFVARRYRQAYFNLEEVINLPLPGFEAVLSSDLLQVKSEDKVYDLMLKWVNRHFPDQPEEKRIVLNKLVRRFLRFPFLNFHRIAEIMTCSDIDRETASEVALGALCYYKCIPVSAYEHEHGEIAGKLIKRAYQIPPLKVLTFDQPPSKWVVYLDLKREECENMSPPKDMFHGDCKDNKCISSEEFYLGKRRFLLQAVCTMDRYNYSFGLWLTPRYQVSRAPKSCIACEISSWMYPSRNFETQKRGVFTVDKDNDRCGWEDLFDVPWTRFIAKGSPYFIDGILRLRAEFAFSY